MLFALDDGSCLVFYAAPRFHELAEIDDAWRNNSVASRSIFVAPSAIGRLDDASHHVAYDEKSAWLCSEPRSIKFLDSNNLLTELNARIAHDRRPLREKLHEIVGHLQAADELAKSRIAERAAPEFAEFKALEREHRPPATQIPTRQPRDLSEAERQLRQASDMAGRLFDAQLIIVQPAAET
jgi:hypothetical protein